MVIGYRAADTAAARRNGSDRSPRKVYLVGGGIASLAAAVFMICDGNIPGHKITILEELGKVGGSLDGSGSPQNGYVLRGGRMLEGKYVCTSSCSPRSPHSMGARLSPRRFWNRT